MKNYLSNCLNSTNEAYVHNAPSRCKTQHEPPLQGSTGLDVWCYVQCVTIPKIVHRCAFFTFTYIACIKDIIYIMIN